MNRLPPDCMDAGDFADWLAAAHRARASAGVSIGSICHDCDPAWRASMAEEGRCNRAQLEDRLAIRAARREAEARVRAGIRRKRTRCQVEALAAEIADLRATGMRWCAIGRTLDIDERYARDLGVRVAA